MCLLFRMLTRVALLSNRRAGSSPLTPAPVVDAPKAAPAPAQEKLVSARACCDCGLAACMCAAARQWSLLRCASPRTTAEHPDTDGPLPAQFPVTVYFGSQTGTAERFGKRLCKAAAAHGFKAALVDLETFSHKLPAGAEGAEAAKVALAGASGLVVFLMATYGEGEATDNALEFSKWLSGSGASSMARVAFTVFGLGNRQYEHYNRQGKVTHSRMVELGGKPFYGHGEGDDGGDLEADFDGWAGAALWSAARAAAGIAGPDTAAAVKPSVGAAAPDQPWRVRWLSALPAGSGTSASDLARQGASADRSGKHFFTAIPVRVTANRELRQAPSRGASTRHVDLSVGGLLEYGTAANVYVCPTNDAAVAAAVAAALGYAPDAVFELSWAGGAGKPALLFPAPTSVATVLARYVDLGGRPDREFLAVLGFYAKGAEKERLLAAAAPEGKAAFAALVTEPQRSVGDLLLEFTSLHAGRGAGREGMQGDAGAALPLQALIAIAPRLQPRPYTIASSAASHPGTLSICASVLNAPKPGAPAGRRLLGAASNTLARAVAGPVAASATGVPPSLVRLCAERDGDGTPLLRVFVRPSTFSLPADASLPVVMVGPGTGIAPMRAFLHERRWQRAKLGPEAVGPTVLFFGCKRRDEDYIYSDELASFVSDGTLTTLHVSFSREGPAKVYVQHTLAAEAGAVWAWIRPAIAGDGGEGERHSRGAGARPAGGSASGGSVYVCGATAMGHDVTDTLKGVGGLFAPLSPPFLTHPPTPRRSCASRAQRTRLRPPAWPRRG
jgi:NADPH-ferrihemoprotein reductase